MANSYATVDELEDRLGIPLGDIRETALSDTLEAASRWIDLTTGHRFYAVSETRYYTLCYPYHNGGTRIDVDDVLSVTALATDNNGDGIYETTWTAVTDYWLSPRNALINMQPYTTINRTGLTGRFYFPAYDEAIAVTGSFGYCTLATRPSNIRELCLMTATLLARPLMDVSVEGASTYKIGAELTVTMSPAELPAMGQKILALYREPALVV